MKNYIEHGRLADLPKMQNNQIQESQAETSGECVWPQIVSCLRLSSRNQVIAHWKLEVFALIVL